MDDPSFRILVLICAFALLLYASYCLILAVYALITGMDQKRLFAYFLFTTPEKREENRRKNARRNEPLGASFKRLVADYQQLSPDAKKLLKDKSGDVYDYFVPPKIVVVGKTTVSYRIYGRRSSDEIEQKIIAIMKSNPNADLHDFEKTLGIQIIEIHSPHKNQLPDSEPKRRPGYLGSNND